MQAGRICPAFILLEFQIFVGCLCVKMSDIFCILCVQSALRKSFHLVEQNLDFRNLKETWKW